MTRRAVQKNLITLTILLFAVVVGGCGTKRPSGEGASVSHLKGVLVAAGTQRMPTIDGNAKSRRGEWDKATPLDLGGPGDFTMKAQYDGEKVAFLATWKDATLSMNTPDSWQYRNGKWLRTRQLSKDPTGWGSFRNHRYPDWFSIYWGKEIPAADWVTQGCMVTCHRKQEEPQKYGLDTGHGVARKGTYCDTWLLLSRHGYGPWFNIEGGWLAGNEGIGLIGEPKFSSGDATEPYQLSAGGMRFTGYAEDRLLTTKDDTVYPKDTEDARYCSACHTKKEVAEQSLVGDEGAKIYYANRNVESIHPTRPMYMEKSPADLADALILTQSEIDDGEAVKVADMNPVQVAKAWAMYERLHATVPQLVLKKPSGSQADIRQGATWKDGVWTVEFARKMDTGHDDDVVLDADSEHHFGVTLFAGTDIGAGWGGTDLVLVFAK